MDAATLIRMGRPKKTEPTEAFRAPRSLVKKLRRLGLHHEMTPGEFLADRFGQQISRLHEKMLSEQAKESDQPPPSSDRK